MRGTRLELALLSAGISLATGCGRSEIESAISPPGLTSHAASGAGGAGAGGASLLDSGAPSPSGGSAGVGLVDASVDAAVDAPLDAPRDTAIDGADADAARPAPPELCDGVDNDLDGLVDEDIPRCEKGAILPMIVAGLQYTCGLDHRGSVRCWGSGFGECPDLAPDCPAAEVPSGQFTEISAGVRPNVCALTTTGEAVCFGSSAVGVPSPGPFVHVAAGASHACGLRASGTIECWGDGTNADRCFTTTGDCGQALPPSGSFVEVSAGNLHTCARREDGTVTCWGKGEDTNDCVGTGICGQAADPTATFTQISAGWTNNCGLQVDGEALCWGSTTGGRSSPPAGPFETLARSHSWADCAIRKDHGVVCWGTTPLVGSLSSPGGAFTEVAVGGHHACGITVAGAVECWNDGSTGCGLGGACRADEPPLGFP